MYTNEYKLYINDWKEYTDDLKVYEKYTLITGKCTLKCTFMSEVYTYFNVYINDWKVKVYTNGFMCTIMNGNCND